MRHPCLVRSFARRPLVWLAVFLAAYWRTYGPANFLHLCDVAVILTCWGLWRAKAWASWLGCIAAALYLPFDIYALATHRHWLATSTPYTDSSKPGSSS